MASYFSNKTNERVGFYIIVAIVVFVLILGWMKWSGGGGGIGAEKEKNAVVYNNNHDEGFNPFKKKKKLQGNKNKLFKNLENRYSGTSTTTTTGGVVVPNVLSAGGSGGVVAVSDTGNVSGTGTGTGGAITEADMVEQTVAFDVPFSKLKKFARKLGSIPESDRMSDITIENPTIHIGVPTYLADRFIKFMGEINLEPNDPNDDDDEQISATTA